MLRDYANLNKKLVLVGQGNKIEIWAADHWQQQLDWLVQGASAMLENSEILVGYLYEPKPQFTTNPDRRIFLDVGPQTMYRYY